MKKMKRVLLLIVIALMASALVACSTPATADDNSANDEVAKRLGDGVNRIGFAMAEITGQAVQTEAQAFEDKAKELGFDDVIILSAENSVETQVTQIKDLITSECDVICVYSADADGVVPAVQACNEAGIPVIAVDRGINGGEIYCTIASNNISDGRDVANYFGLMTEGEAEDSVKVLHIIGNLSSTAQKERADGFRIGCENWGQLEIVDEVATDADADRIYNAVVDAFKVNPDIKAIFVPYDQLLSPVVSALKEIGMFYPAGDPNHVMLGAVDGATEQLEWLSEGINDISISLDFLGFGQTAASVAADYVNGISSNDVVLTKSIVCTAGNVEYLAKAGMLWGLSE
ncbi:MAG: sugar ABC transporter substrate-binding protein [Eubacteriales bacterium]|nr:sugar ABC transporter substrate-binding protein [Eubacteriales bacterium]